MPDEQVPAQPIIVLFGSASGPKLERYWGERDNLGILLAPLAWRTPWCRWWATDNDVFSHRADPCWWTREGETNWLRMLDKIDNLPSPSAAAAFRRGAGGEVHGPMFVLLPDVVADWKRTLARYHEYLDDVRGRGLPFAIALQNGAEHDFATVARLNPHYVFIGGTVDWKWRHIEPICAYFQPRNIKVHVGRASGPWRIRECIRAGATSCDGTGWGRFADNMLPGLYQTLDNSHPQQRLQI